MTETTAEERRSTSAQETVFPIILAIGACHMLNDMMQSLLQAIYPTIKSTFDLDFAHIGLITLVFQITASFLQPLVGLYTDRHSVPYALPAGMIFTFVGLLLLALAPTYPLLLLGAGIVGMGSSVFHPESSRVAYLAAGPRRGLAQSIFQVGGNFGGALGPLLAALVVGASARSGIAWFSAAALLAIVILWNVANWHVRHGVARAARGAAQRAHADLPRSRVMWTLFVLVALIFSKFVYLASLSSYFTFYLIHKFHVSVEASQIHLFVFLASIAVGTLSGGPLGDRFGRKHLIWFSILGALPFALAMPYANLFWTSILSICAGMVLSCAFPAIVVYGQELLPGRVGAISGLFFGLSFGMGGLGAAALGLLADATGIEFVYKVCAFLPAIGLLAAFLPDLKRIHHTASPQSS